MTKWRIDFSNEAEKFLIRNKLTEQTVIKKIILAVEKFQGKQTNIDIKKLSGKWAGFFRIRSGRIRIIVEFNFEEFSAYVETIDWRGRVYK